MAIANRTSKTIRVIAGIVTSPDGHVLLVRKHGTSAFMQPGGKSDPEETHVETLSREIREELGCEINQGAILHRGTFVSTAANEPGFKVEAELYDVQLIGTPEPSAEIAEIIWLDPACSGSVVLAPLTRDHVLGIKR